MTITTVDAGPRTVSRSVALPVAAEEIFAILADPHRHAELDGSGTVKDTTQGPARLSQGASFSVNMKQYGVPYRITSRVTSFADGRTIEWRHPLGHRWRWELAPQPDGTTLVTETFDYSTVLGVQARVLELVGIPKQNAAGIEGTLRKLQERFP